MNPVKMIGIVLLIAGLLGVVYGGFTYTRDTSSVDVGPVEFTIKDRETVNIPMWAGVGAMVVGGVLLVFGSTKR